MLVILNENQIAFGQVVCCFDLLCYEGQLYLCDINGWIFVKNSYNCYNGIRCTKKTIIGLLLSDISDNPTKVINDNQWKMLIILKEFLP